MDGPLNDALLITLTGADRPGITAEIATLVAQSGATLLDVEQVVVGTRLNLNFLVRLDAPDTDSKPLLKEVLWKARELDMHADFHLMEPEAPGPKRATWAVTLLADPISADVLAGAAQAIQAHGFNIDRINRLSGKALSALELIVGAPADDNERVRRLQASLVGLQAELGCDIAVQAEGLTRRSKRLVVMDMDSTLIKQEVIDELARAYGVLERVADITHRAMNGELDFDQALRERVKLLAGAPVSILDDVQARLELTPGAESLLAVLQRLGYRLAVISGGFIEIVEPFRRKLGLDYGFANQLGIRDGRLTGEVLGPIVNRRRKADLLESLAQTERISLDQVIAIGDGANDLDMLDRAGLGIAFNAKRVVREKARHAINQPSLASILYLLGIRDEDLPAVGLRGS